MHFNRRIAAIGIVLFTASCSDQAPKTPPSEAHPAPVVRVDDAKEVALVVEKTMKVAMKEEKRLAHVDMLFENVHAASRTSSEASQAVIDTIKSRPNYAGLSGKEIEAAGAKQTAAVKSAQTAVDAAEKLGAQALAAANRAENEGLHDTEKSALDLGEKGALDAGAANPDVKVPVGQTPEDYAGFVKSVRANDLQGAVELVLSKRLYLLPSGIRILKIDGPGLGVIQVRILSGEHQGKTGWTDQRSWVINE